MGNFIESCSLYSCIYFLKSLMEIIDNFNGDMQHDNSKPKNKMVIRSKSPVTVGCVFGSK